MRVIKKIGYIIRSGWPGDGGAPGGNNAAPPKSDKAIENLKRLRLRYLKSSVVRQSLDFNELQGLLRDTSVRYTAGLKSDFRVPWTLRARLESDIRIYNKTMPEALAEAANAAFDGGVMSSRPIICLRMKKGW